MTHDEQYMHRCLQLAALGLGPTAPNPLVGAVLVHQGSIIGEGYHKQYGHAHAEVNCIDSVPSHEQQFIPHSTLYVNLEPCAHVGKTPPCADFIIAKGIKEVVIANLDPFIKVDGKGIEKLQAAGVLVRTGILEHEASILNKRFLCFHTKHRPYIILKWAQSANGFISGPQGDPLKISNEISDRFVHRWRSEEAAILVGTNTAAIDNPNLTNRLWTGNSPVRVVLDKNLRLAQTLNLFHGGRTVVLNFLKSELVGSAEFVIINEQVGLPSAICEALSALSIQSVLVEGGTQLLNSFIDSGIWDEARVIVNKKMVIDDGIKAPHLFNASKTDATEEGSDLISTYIPIL
ncbi:MAG: bifunctional diaminohydroxyphosphoribosylaminopyrimidine deaminase/5-amino-6-(5-phosphoribosylamino)uracil reductase RibD [Chitinophagaceae bacterium]|nr:bifunctional diaminohydroxyphosphoribosylaminopyrimidine deaminase/5-amino-6-(5-phosphoribosylamino)uracil reductase RibD [Chitinophagaceae bacterium]